MTRPIRTRRIDSAAVAIMRDMRQTQEVATDRVIWTPPEGIRKDRPLSQLKPSESPDLKNFRIKYGAYQARPVVVRMGGELADPILRTAVATTQYGDEILYALTTRGIWELVGDRWIQLSGPVLRGEAYTNYSIAAWGGKLVYASEFDMVGEVDPATRTYAAIVGAPVARHVATVAGRLVAGYVDSIPNRISWTAKNNSHDWSGFGSGYEDLLNTPGGIVDAVRGIFPVGQFDTVVVRTFSIWLMRETGQFDAPFSFTKLWDIPGTVAAGTLQQTPSGIVGMFRDNLYIVTSSAPPEKIGLPVKPVVYGEDGIDYASAAYDVWEDEYCLTIPKDDESVVWRYSLSEKKWTKDCYDFPVWRLGSVLMRVDMAIEDLPGTMEELEGPFELLGLGGQFHGLTFVTAQAGHTVLREDVEGIHDQSPNATLPDMVVEGEIWSGQLFVASPMQEIFTSEVAIEYTATRAVPVRMDYSVDGGESWTIGLEQTIQATTRTRLVTFGLQVTAKRLMIRLHARDAAGLVVIAAYPKMGEGGRSAN